MTLFFLLHSPTVAWLPGPVDEAPVKKLTKKEREQRLLKRERERRDEEAFMLLLFKLMRGE